MNVVKLQKRIDRGIKLLEALYPGELAKLDADTIDMAMSTRCVVARIAGVRVQGLPSYWTGIGRLGLSNKEARRHGFLLSDKHNVAAAQQWTLAWRSRIRELQNLATG